MRWVLNDAWSCTLYLKKIPWVGITITQGIMSCVRYNCVCAIILVSFILYPTNCVRQIRRKRSETGVDIPTL